MIMTDFAIDGMASYDLTIDRIHLLVERAQESAQNGMSQEAKILMAEATDHADAIRAGFISTSV